MLLKGLCLGAGLPESAAPGEEMRACCLSRGFAQHPPQPASPPDGRGHSTGVKS